MKYLQLIRYKNLLFLIFTQLLISACVINPPLTSLGIEFRFIYVYLLLMATVLITAGGYIINDYFDVKMDAINKPDRQVVGKSISRSLALKWYQILTIAGVLIGCWLAWQVRSITLGLLFLTIPGLLWFYSASYKRQLIIGNVIVAFLAGIAILIIGITIVAAIQKTYGQLPVFTAAYQHIYSWSGGFALFAFLVTWLREIIKDMEDEAGDREMECHTLPIVWGAKVAKIAVLILSTIIIALLLYVTATHIPFTGTFTLRYWGIGVVIPLLVLNVWLFRAKSTLEYRKASGMAKFIMLMGVLYAPIFYYLWAKQTGTFIINF